jgi:hypothetical protein
LDISNKIGGIFGKLVFAVLILFTAYGLSRNYFVRNFSESRLTCATVISKYSSSKDYGVTIEYRAGDENVEIDCTSDICKRLKVGYKFNIEYYTYDVELVNLHVRDKSKCY